MSITAEQIELAQHVSRADAVALRKSGNVDIALHIVEVLRTMYKNGHRLTANQLGFVYGVGDWAQIARFTHPVLEPWG